MKTKKLKAILASLLIASVGVGSLAYLPEAEAAPKKQAMWNLPLKIKWSILSLTIAK